MMPPCLRDMSNAVNGYAKEVSKSDASTMCIVFVAALCAILPLDISQLSFAVIGAVLYVVLQKSDKTAPRKKTAPAVRAAEIPPWRAAKPAPKNHTDFVQARHKRIAKPLQRSTVSSEMKLPAPVQAIPTPVPAGQEVLKTSVQPILPPTFHSTEWDGEVQELLMQITPTPEVHQIVHRVAQMMAKTLKATVPEIEVTGFATGNLTCGRAFGVAVPDVEVTARVSPHVLFRALRSRNPQGGSESEKLDERKLQKSSLRIFTDQLVAAGFKFRRSAFKGQEPKVTLLVPQSLGIFGESIPIDFSVNVVTPVHNAALLADCEKIDARAKDLVLLVKRWAKDRAICHTPKGHLSPYLWGLLTMYFLQVCQDIEGAILPALEHFEACSKLANLSGGNTNSQWKVPERTQHKSVALLFKQFVRFFNEEFDWQSEAVSIRLGRRATAKDLRLSVHAIASEISDAPQVGPSIEDPFQASNNLGECMTATSFLRLKEEFSRAQQLCTRSASLSELLEPWAPSGPEVGELA